MPFGKKWCKKRKLLKISNVFVTYFIYFHSYFLYQNTIFFESNHVEKIIRV